MAKVAPVVTDAVLPGPTFGGAGTPGGDAGLKGFRYKIITLTYDTNYLAGGTAITPAQLAGLKALAVRGHTCVGVVGGLNTATIVNPAIQTDGSITVKLFYHNANTAVLAEVPDNTAIGSPVVRLLVIGRES